MSRKPHARATDNGKIVLRQTRADADVRLGYDPDEALMVACELLAALDEVDE